MDSRFGTCVMVLALMAAACAAPLRDVGPGDTRPVRYDCSGTVVVRSGDALVVNEETANLVRRDDRVDVYTVAGHADVEYFVPHDRLADAVRLAGPAGAPCVVEGGYTDALRRFAGGATIAEVANQLAISDVEAHRRVGVALRQVRCRYYDC